MNIPFQFSMLLKWKIFRNSSKISNQITISKEGSGVKSVLFLLPENIEDAKLAHYLAKVDDPIPGYRFGYICSKKSKRYYPSSSRLRFFTYGEEDLNYFGVIKTQGLLDKIQSTNYEALVDLNTRFSATTLMLAYELDIALKIGFNSPIADYIYNIILDYDQNKFFENNFLIIQRLLNIKI